MGRVYNAIRDAPPDASQPAPPAWLKRAGQYVPLIVAVAALVIFTRTLLPGVAFGDWGEMATVPHILGIAHPTGYPTYIILAWLTELIPLGSIAFRANLLSAVYVSLALATLSLISLRLGVRPILAIAGALAIGAVGTVWAAATVAKVNPLLLLFVAMIMHRALVWAERHRPVDLALTGLLVGLALGSHPLMVSITPFVAVFVLWAGRHELIAKPWLLAWPVAAGLLGLSVYLYIPLAASQSPPLAYNHPTTLDSVIWLVTGTQFHGQFDFFAARGPGNFVTALPTLWSLLVARGTIVVPALGALGLVRLVWLRPAFGLMCVAVLVSGLYLWANYLELEHYLLVPWLILAIGLSVGLEGLACFTASAARLVLDGRGETTSDDGRTARFRRVSSGLVGAAGLVLVVVLGALNWAAADRSNDRSGPTFVDAVFSALPHNAAILSEWDASTPLWYGQHVEGRRTDLLIVDDTNIVYEHWGTREARIASLICSRSVFILRLGKSDLGPTRQAYRIVPFLTVSVAAGGPSAVVSTEIYQVLPLSASTCP